MFTPFHYTTRVELFQFLSASIHKILFACISEQTLHDTYNSILCVIDYGCDLVMSFFPPDCDWLADLSYHTILGITGYYR